MQFEDEIKLFRCSGYTHERKGPMIVTLEMVYIR